MQRSLKSVLGLVCLVNCAIAEASSREHSFSRRPMRSQSIKQTDRDDFFLRFLKEMYKHQSKAQSFSTQSADRGFFEWVPDGSLFSAVPSECLPESFEQKARRVGMTPSEYGAIAQDYFNRCGSYLSARATGGLMGLIDFAMASYPYLENSKITAYKFPTKDGRVVNGFIGIKDQTPRPWVIYKCGVFCAAEPSSASLKNYMIHLFDQTPFNVIFLGNRTGQDYIVENRAFNFGGYFEAQDFIDIGQWLRYESPYKNLVSSVHAVAVSLGGSAAYLMQQRLSTTESQKRGLFQSVSSLCAVSDLKPTVDNMYDDTLKGFIFHHLTWFYLNSVKHRLSDVDDILTDEPPERYQFPNILGRLAARFMSNRSQTQLFGADNDALEEAKQNEFWQRSQYSAQSHRYEVPMFVWASEDDSVVDYYINTQTLAKARSQQRDPNLGIVGVPMGDHCGFATAYSYSVTSTMLRTFILNNSPEFQINTQAHSLPMTTDLAPMIEGERIVSYWWSQGRNQDRVIQLNMEIYGADDSLCPAELEMQGPESCYRVAAVTFPEGQFASFGMNAPNNLVEKEALIRELNGRVSILSQGQSIIGKTQWPQQLLFRY